ncbi:MAG: DUF503 domain-containing protein [Dehalococcoidia bacterium]|nr:DUF503 domain-containing protein [Dehalococcoidia bacterium]
MHVGTCILTIRLPENHSLKGKRQVVLSMTARLRNQFRVSAAEVDSQGLWQIATIGVACVSNQADHSRETMDNVINFVLQNYPEVELVESQVEVIPVP